MLKRFLRDTSANIAMMFGLVTIPLIAATGGAIDYSRAFEQRLVVQDALDAAALAANRLIGIATEDEIYAEALAFFNANTDGRVDNELTLSMVLDGGTVELTTSLPVPTAILGIVGVDSINFNLRALTLAGAATYEVVLVLDNSGSMNGSKIDTLKTAATDLVNSLFALNISNPQPDPIRIGIVPFAASVNVGPANANAGWMDAGGLAPNAGINFNGDFTSRFDLFDTLADVTWGGCVEARAYPHDVADTTPTNLTPATLFQPMFAPDEPGDEGAGGWGAEFRNTYLDDDAGVCEVTVGGAVPCDGLTGSDYWMCIWYGIGDTTTPGPDHCDAGDDACLQERVCKYDGETLGWEYNGLGEGPNLNCTTDSLTAMSTDQAALISSINAMYASGWTNIEEGIMWGWRLLSDNAPYSEGRPYGEVGNQKILIVMTDGANTYGNQYSNMNSSEYMAFNYIINDYLGTQSYNQNTIVDQMNDRTIEACSNIHDTEITIYTIAFQVSDVDAQQILEGCATDENKTFEASNNAELVAVFQLIAQDIATLRVAE